MRVRLIVFVTLVFAVLAGVVAWVLNAPSVNHWLAVHTGTVNESGPYYGFWSGSARISLNSASSAPALG